MVPFFYQQRDPFNFVSDIFVNFFAWKNYKGNLSALFEIKLNHEITNWSCNQKIKNIFISRPTYLLVQCWIIFCDNFWDMFPLGITCDRKVWPKVISKYLQEVTRKFKSYSLILAKVLHTCNFIKSTLHMNTLLAIFRILPNSWKTLGQVQRIEPSGCVLSLWHIISFLYF